MEYFSAAEYFFYAGYRHGLSRVEWDRYSFLYDEIWIAYQDGLVIGRIDRQMEGG